LRSLCYSCYFTRVGRLGGGSLWESCGDCAGTTPNSEPSSGGRSPIARSVCSQPADTHGTYRRSSSYDHRFGYRRLLQTLWLPDGGLISMTGALGRTLLWARKRSLLACRVGIPLAHKERTRILRRHLVLFVSLSSRCRPLTRVLSFDWRRARSATITSLHEPSTLPLRPVSFSGSRSLSSPEKT
jgi:hypothetical protein